MRDKVLVLDDEENLRKILDETLSRAGYEVFSFAGFPEAKEKLNTEDIDVVITDLQMPEYDGMDVLRYCKQYSPDLPVILITAYGSIDRAVAALKGGAFDFIPKPFGQDELIRMIEKAVQSRIRRRREPIEDAVTTTGMGPVPYPLFGNSPSTVALRSRVEQASKSRSHVWIVGDMGTGKRSIAHEIHRKSDRSRGPFIEMHAEAIPEVFHVSEVFGTEKGATPVSFFSKPGYLELAQGGTLYIEDITALSPDAQSAFLSALENEFFSRVGGMRSFPLDFRIISTSTENEKTILDSEKFNTELFYKLSSELISIQPICERKEDLVSHLVQYFLERACNRRGMPCLKMEPDALQWFTEQSWPGNFAELERTIDQVVNRVTTNSISLKDLTA